MTISRQSATLTTQKISQSIINISYTRGQSGLSLDCYSPITENKPKNYGEKLLNNQLVAIADQLHKYIAVNHFYYDAVEALFNERSWADDASDYSQYGLTLITDWLRAQDSALLESLSQITSRATLITDCSSTDKL